MPYVGQRKRRRQTRTWLDDREAHNMIRIILRREQACSVDLREIAHSIDEPQTHNTGFLPGISES